MRRKRSAGKDLLVILMLIAVVFGLVSFTKEATITGQITEPINHAPEWTGETSSFTTVKNEFLVISLGEHFTDPDRDQLTYLASEASNIGLEVSGQQLKITPEQDFTGERLIPVFASDSEETTKHTIILTVLETPEEPEEPALEVNDAIKDQNGRAVGKKIEEDYTFNTIIDNVERTPNEIIITFHHNARDELPVWIEDWSDYKLSKQTALPGETITLTVPLVKGIVPKFKLHVGKTSDIFEFGKTIPSARIIDDRLDAGQYKVYDRDDDYVDVELTKGGSRAVINAAASEDITVKIGEIENLHTKVIAADPIAMGGATITLEKTGKVSVIKTCEDFDTETFACSGKWEVTDIPFTDMGDYIIFTIDHFSAYAGGTATDLTIWDDSDLGTQFTGLPMTFYANFTNTIGSANRGCRIRLNTTGAFGQWINMTFNAAGNDIYNYTTIFNTQGTPHYYEINCTGAGESTAAIDSFYLYQLNPNQELLSCTHRTGIACLPGETRVLGLFATTNTRAELPNQNNYDTSICCQDLSGKNIISRTGTPFLSLNNYTNAQAAIPESTMLYTFNAQIGGSKKNITCSYTKTKGLCRHPAGCIATLSEKVHAKISDCINNPYNITICCGFPLLDLPAAATENKKDSVTSAVVAEAGPLTISAAGQAIQKPQMPVKPVYTQEEPEIKENKLAETLPFITYSLIILLTISLLIHLIREHFIGKETHDILYYSMHALFALSVLFIAAEILLTEQIPYPAIFAAGAIAMVFILDALLRRIAARPLRKEKPATTLELKKEKMKEDELEELSRKLKELKI